MITIPDELTSQTTKVNDHAAGPGAHVTARAGAELDSPELS